MMKKLKIGDIAFIGIMVAGAMILSYVESFFTVGIPGLKLGMPNIFVIVVLYKYGPWHALSLSVVRSLLSALLFGSVMSLWYSLAGALLSLLVMSLLVKTKFFSEIGISIAGGISHNIGQIAVAILVTGVKEIAFYLPILAVGGTVAGVVVGICAHFLYKVAKKLRS